MIMHHMTQIVRSLMITLLVSSSLPIMAQGGASWYQRLIPWTEASASQSKIEQLTDGVKNITTRAAQYLPDRKTLEKKWRILAADKRFRYAMMTLGVASLVELSLYAWNKGQKGEDKEPLPKEEDAQIKNLKTRFQELRERIQKAHESFGLRATSPSTESVTIPFNLTLYAMMLKNIVKQLDDMLKTLAQCSKAHTALTDNDLTDFGTKIGSSMSDLKQIQSNLQKDRSVPGYENIDTEASEIEELMTMFKSIGKLIEIKDSSSEEDIEQTVTLDVMIESFSQLMRNITQKVEELGGHIETDSAIDHEDDIVVEADPETIQQIADNITSVYVLRCNNIREQLDLLMQVVSQKFQDEVQQELIEKLQGSINDIENCALTLGGLASDLKNKEFVSEESINAILAIDTEINNLSIAFNALVTGLNESMDNFVVESPSISPSSIGNERLNVTPERELKEEEEEEEEVDPEKSEDEGSIKSNNSIKVKFSSLTPIEIGAQGILESNFKEEEEEDDEDDAKSTGSVQLHEVKENESQPDFMKFIKVNIKTEPKQEVEYGPKEKWEIELENVFRGKRKDNRYNKKRRRISGQLKVTVEGKEYLRVWREQHKNQDMSDLEKSDAKALMLEERKKLQRQMRRRKEKLKKKKKKLEEVEVKVEVNVDAKKKQCIVM